MRRLKRANQTIFQAFDLVVEKDPNKTVLYCEDFTMTRKQVSK
jgi:hypothetical protein